MAQDADALADARALLAGYDLSAAQPLIEAALAEERSASALSAMARLRVLQMRDAYDEALRLAAEALQLDPAYQEAIATRSMVHAIRARGDEALATADRALALGAEDPWSQVARARALVTLHRADEAEAVLGRLLEARPGYLPAVEGLALMYLYDMGRRAEGIALLSGVIESADNPAHFLRLRAEAYAEAGETEAALGDYAEANRAAPHDGALWYDHASVLFLERRYDEMDAVIDAAFEAGVDPCVFLILRGQSVELQGDFDGALALYEQAAEADPAHDRPHFRMAYVYRDHLRDYERCIAAWGRAIELSDEPADYYWRRGHAHLRFRNREEAFNDFNTAVGLDGSHVGALAGVAELGPPRDALPIYQRLIELEPSNPEWPGRIGFLYDRAGDDLRAIEWYTRCLELGPDNAHARRNRGLLYKSNGQQPEAIADFTYIIEHGEQRAMVARAYFDRGNAHSRAGDYERAGDDMAESIRRGNTMPAAFYNLGLSYHRRALWDEAIEAYSAAIERFPDYANALGNRAICYGSVGDYERALADIERSMSLRDRPEAWEYSVIAGIMRGMGRHAEALEAAQQSINREPARVIAWGERLAAELALGLDGSAEDTARAMATLDVQSVSRLLIARLYFQHGHAQTARQWLKIVIDDRRGLAGSVYRYPALLELALGELDRAADYTELYLRDEPDYIDGHLYRVIIAKARGDADALRDCLDAGRALEAHPEQPGHALLDYFAEGGDPRALVDGFGPHARRAEAAMWVGYWLVLDGDRERGLAYLREAVACPEPYEWEGAFAIRLLDRLAPEADAVEGE